MSDVKQKMTVNIQKCKGCALCKAVCPKKIVEIQKEKRNDKGYFYALCVNPEKCISCAMCAMMCPDCAIKIEK